MQLHRLGKALLVRLNFCISMGLFWFAFNTIAYLYYNFFVWILFYRSTFNESDIFDFNHFNEILQHSNYDQNKRTVLYLHGYSESPSSHSVHLIVNSYLARSDDYNIIILDWSIPASENYLFAAVPNAISVSRNE